MHFFNKCNKGIRLFTLIYFSFICNRSIVNNIIGEFFDLL